MRVNLSSSAASASSDELNEAGSLRQITGRELLAGQTQHAGELADPAPPIEVDGKLRIYGTGSYCIEFDTWSDLLSGTFSRKVPVELLHPDGVRLVGHQSAWDLSIHRWSRAHSAHPTEVLYAGVMTPTEGRTIARWPEDNWNRRVYAFTRLNMETWIRHPVPVLGTTPREDSQTWLGHSYGHHFVTDKTGRTWIFYEKVVEERPDRFGQAVPFRTDIFARRMINPYRAEDTEMSILDVGTPPYPSTMRQHPVDGAHNGFLVEGPRPFRIQADGREIYLLGFSSGDFATDRYTLNVAWSERVTGPYTPFLAEAGTAPDLYDFGAALADRYHLSWGPARPAFFNDPSGSLWVLFHAVDKKILPDRSYAQWPTEPLENFHRNIYLAPVRIEIDGIHPPSISIGE